MKLEPEGRVDYLSINTSSHNNASASSLSLVAPHPLRFAFPDAPLTQFSSSAVKRSTLVPLLSHLPPYLQATKRQSDGDESHGPLDSFPLALVLAARPVPQ